MQDFIERHTVFSSNYLCLRTKIKIKRNITLPMYGYTFITVLKKNNITYKT